MALSSVFQERATRRGVPKAVSAHQIGGYQVLAKQLKDRKRHELSKEELEHYRRVVKALERTSEVWDRIDEVYTG
jgi:hypothetical protein